MVFREEDATIELMIRVKTLLRDCPVPSAKPPAQLFNLNKKLVRLENLVRKCSKCKVKIVLDLGLFETSWLGKTRPNVC